MKTEEETIIAGRGEETVVAGPVKCPACGTENAAGGEWCEECGFFLSSEPEEVAARPVFAKLVDSATGAEYPLKEGENTVGRGPCDVVLAADGFLSRSHAKIVVEPPNVYLEDLGSTNGTFLNGERVEAGQRVTIGPGDQIRFASTVLELVAPEAETRGIEASRHRGIEIGMLEIEDGEGKGGPFRLFQGENLLGRHPVNEVPLGFDGHISGRHAKITASEGGVFIEDLGSTNGTELNGRRLTPGSREALSDGDEIRMGKTVLKWRVQSVPTSGQRPESGSRLAEGEVGTECRVQSAECGVEGEEGSKDEGA